MYLLVHLAELLLRVDEAFYKELETQRLIA